MILNRQLNVKESRESQHHYILFCGVNGFSYMCLGETVLILFAVRLHFPDYWVACLGAMQYLGFIMLPVGKMLTAKYGAVRCEADCWVYRNFAALLVASSAPLTLFFSSHLGLATLLLGAFFFYGFRAAGVVMCRPLLGEIASAGTRGRLIARSWVFFYFSNVMALLLIFFSMRWFSSVWMLFAIIIIGTIVGISSSFVLRRISETGDIQAFARKKLLPIMPQLLKNRTILSQIIAGMICNLCIILTTPLSMLALKQGYHISDTTALIYFLVQLFAAIGASKVMEKYSDMLGGRTMTLIGFYGFYGIIVFWLLAPSVFVPWLLIIPFLLCCCGTTVAANALELYFLNTVSKNLQVSACIISSVATGVVSGLIGMLLSGGLLKIASVVNRGSSLQTYKIYFFFVLLLMPLLGIFVHRLPRENNIYSGITVKPGKRS